MAQLLYSYRNCSQSEGSATASRIGELTYENPVYKDAQKSVIALRAANTDYIRKAEIAKQGGKDRIAEKNAQYKIVVACLDAVAADVIVIAQGDEAIITGAGFKVRTPGKSLTELPRPANLVAEFFPKEGSCQISFDKIEGINFYMIRACTVGGEWRMIKHTTTPSKTVLHGFVLGERMAFSVQAMGADGLVSEWSLPAEITIS